MAKKNETTAPIAVTDPNKFMKILLSTSLDNSHLQEFNFTINELGDNAYHIIGELEGADSINFEHKYN